MTLARRVLLVAVAACAAAGCVSAQDCAESIPAELRADALRYVLDQQLVERDKMPTDAVEVAYVRGAPYASLSDDRRRLLAPYAVGYASCIRERVERH